MTGLRNALAVVCRITSLTFFLLALNISPSVLAQECASTDSTMLWQVENDAHPVYLFGSIHVGKPQFYPLPDVIEELFASADNLVFEVDPTVLENPMTILQMQSRGSYSDGQTLADNISSDTLNDLKKVMADNGLPIEAVMGMKPWFVTSLVSSLEVLKMGFLPDYGIENYIMTKKRTDAAILELESLEQQLDFLESLDSEQYLSYTLDSLGEEGQAVLQDLISAWQCADHERLEKVLFAEFSNAEMNDALKADMEGLYDLMFTQRNQAMAAGVEEILETGSGSYLVVVGSGHLLGEGSVIDLLESSGFTVTNVSAQ